MNRENRRVQLKCQKDTLTTKRDLQVFYIDSDKDDASMHSGRAYTSMHACREGIYTINWRLPTWLQPLLLPNVTLTPLVTTGAKHLTHTTLYLAILLQLQTTNYISVGASIEIFYTGDKHTNDLIPCNWTLGPSAIVICYLCPNCFKLHFFAGTSIDIFSHLCRTYNWLFHTSDKLARDLTP